MANKDLEITIEIIHHKFSQLQKINCSKIITLREIASEMGIKVTRLMDFYESNKILFLATTIKKGKTSHLAFREVYLKVVDNPETQEWLDQKIKENTKTLKLSDYDNYGHVSGHYIEPSKNKEAFYLNTSEKLMLLKERFNLKEASYWLGGLGDCCRVEPKDGWELPLKVRDILKSEGWTLLGEKFGKDVA